MNILPVLDDLERALRNVEPAPRGPHLDRRHSPHLSQVPAILEAAGVKPIEAEGKDFDPRYHEATMSADGDEGKVIAEVQRGYLLGERVHPPGDGHRRSRREAGAGELGTELASADG